MMDGHRRDGVANGRSWPGSWNRSRAVMSQKGEGRRNPASYRRVVGLCPEFTIPKAKGGRMHVDGMEQAQTCNRRLRENRKRLGALLMLDPILLRDVSVVTVNVEVGIGEWICSARNATDDTHQTSTGTQQQESLIPIKRQSYLVLVSKSRSQTEPCHCLKYCAGTQGKENYLLMRETSCVETSRPSCGAPPNNGTWRNSKTRIVNGSRQASRTGNWRSVDNSACLRRRQRNSSPPAPTTPASSRTSLSELTQWTRCGTPRPSDQCGHCSCRRTSTTGFIPHCVSSSANQTQLTQPRCTSHTSYMEDTARASSGSD
ncbi:hypothetical protein F5144DRAFT_327709 [Chaetomium tenue]|uniref:Uncharacterized protein n=1 Tax=Chaetomium tenue TaxID=1854479 RepID=A0ACB7P9A5_9PEZI|nr:hypothetical protein F5144DRAFT_327709 [Chaetomium globosum]